MNGIYLLLGSNKGDRMQQLNLACLLLQKRKIDISAHSSVYETAPWGIKDQAWFLNAVVRITTPLPPEALLETCLDVEEEMGRKREIKWGPRIIDIDILFYEDLVISTKNLSLPHPGIPERRFTLVLLNELIPNEMHPTLQKTQAELLRKCKDPSECRITNYQLDLDLD